MSHPPDQGQTGKAIGMILLANLLFSMVDTSTKWLVGAGLAALQLAFLRYFIHFVITLVQTRHRSHIAVKLTKRQRALVAIRAFCLVSATVANFFALGHLPLAVTAAILFVSPVLICIFAWALLGETITPRHWLAVILGLAGVLLIVQPFGEAVNWYAVLMLYPATGMAMYTVLTRKLSGEIRPATLQFYTGALGTIVLLPFGLSAWAAISTPLEWTLAFSIGAFAWAGHEILTRAHAHAEASVLAPFGYSFVLYLSLAGWIVFDHVPAWNVAVGAVIIVAAGLTIWAANRDRNASILRHVPDP